MVAENPKVTITIVAGAIVQVVCFVLRLAWDIDIPAAIQMALGIITIFLIGRFTRMSKKDAEELERIKTND